MAEGFQPAQPGPEPGSAFAAGVAGAAAQAFIGNAAASFGQSDTLRKWQPWSLWLGDLSKYSMPSPRDLSARVQSNLRRFYLNYLVIFGALFSIFALLDFKVLMLLLVTVVAWLFLYQWRSAPLRLLDKEIPPKIVQGTIVGIAGLLFLLMMGKTIFYIVFLVGTLAMLHSTFYTSEEETVDFTSSKVQTCHPLNSTS